MSKVKSAKQDIGHLSFNTFPVLHIRREINCRILYSPSLQSQILFKFTPFPNICPSGVSHETFLPEAERETDKRGTIFYPQPYQPHFDMRSSAKNRKSSALHHAIGSSIKGGGQERPST
ncbi:hypothetical protein CDAR_208471 [Caerostris darwini]|uniref:Uncharacterized protein n=1 Tax=Caerostris darwini TaxID=1538125 RepID=A0AAV4VAG2_9ARAC|nr:hypothetical protein CDAR_208471 [Caerostris darwini]